MRSEPEKKAQREKQRQREKQAEELRRIEIAMLKLLGRKHPDEVARMAEKSRFAVV